MVNLFKRAAMIPCLLVMLGDTTRILGEATGENTTRILGQATGENSGMKTLVPSTVVGHDPNHDLETSFWTRRHDHDHDLENKLLDKADVAAPKQGLRAWIKAKQQESTVAEESKIRSLNIFPLQRWKDRSGDVAIVPYKIDGAFNQEQKDMIVSAVDDISAKTGVVKFIPRTTHSAYISVQSDPSSGCSSIVGKSGTGRVQALNLEIPGCLSVGIIQHEFMHALGFHHEQNRPDRDNWVSINFSNILSRYAHNFDTASGSTVLGSPYQYASVMHYGAYDFAIDETKPTIIAKRSGGDLMGSRAKMSDDDVLKIRLLYQCKTGGRTLPEYNSDPCTSNCKCHQGATGCNGNNDACQGDLVCTNNRCEVGGGGGGGGGGGTGGGCTDEPGWADSDGDDCAFYSQEGNCADFGADYANNGKTANDACCVCGGGSTGSVKFFTFQPAAYTGYCMDLPSASTSNGNTIQLYQCNGTPSQKWYWDSNQYIRSSVDLTKCMVGSAGSTALDTTLIINDCFARDNRFLWDYYSDGSIRPRNNNQVCVGPTVANNAWGPLELNDCSFTSSKQWQFYYANRRRQLSSSSEDEEPGLLTPPELLQQDAQVVQQPPRETQGQSCVDLPNGWYDVFGYNCLWYGEQDDRCSEYGFTGRNFDKTAAQACCVCEGGSTAATNNGNNMEMGDAVENLSGCWDKPGWRDAGGDDCIWYSQGDNCDFYGHEYALNGLPANEACCACGGGSNMAPPAETAALTPGCSNTPNDWRDDNGDGCDFYASKADSCQLYGDNVGVGGKTAKEVCCVCGGGFDPKSRLGEALPGPPTMAPVSAGNPGSPIATSSAANSFSFMNSAVLLAVTTLTFFIHI